jgi:hypothetical protein
MKKYLFLLGCSAAIFAISCKKDNGGGGGGTVQIDCSTVTFSGNIAPMIASKCAVSGCHDASSSNGPGPLINHASIFASRSAIQNAVNSNRMPQGGPPLSDTEKARIKCWIDGGAPNN